MASPSENWSSFKDYLKNKEEGLISAIKSYASAADDKKVSVACVKLTLIGELITKAESLDRGDTAKGRVTPEIHRY